MRFKRSIGFTRLFTRWWVWLVFKVHTSTYRVFLTGSVWYGRNVFDRNMWRHFHNTWYVIILLIATAKFSALYIYIQKTMTFFYCYILLISNVLMLYKPSLSIHLLTTVRWPWKYWQCVWYIREVGKYCSVTSQNIIFLYSNILNDPKGHTQSCSWHQLKV